MKNLLLSCLMLITLSATSQIEKIQGIWKSVESECLTKISYNKEKFKFKNICDFDIDETVVNKGKDFVTTTSINKENNYKVVIKYTLLDNGNLNANFVGDFKGVIIYKRYDE